MVKSAKSENKKKRVEEYFRLHLTDSRAVQILGGEVTPARHNDGRPPVPALADLAVEATVGVETADAGSSTCLTQQHSGTATAHDSQQIQIQIQITHSIEEYKYKSE